MRWGKIRGEGKEERGKRRERRERRGSGREEGECFC
jgi:hypothetical protein